MGSSGKALAIIAGIIVLIGTFFTSWFSIGGENAHGIGLLKNVLEVYSNPGPMATSWGIPAFVPYIIATTFILFLIAWVFLFIGASSRFFAIFGSILTLLIAIAVFMGNFNIPDDFSTYTAIFMDSEDVIPGIIPFNLGLITSGVATINLGAILLLSGGILGLISGVKGR